MRRAVHGPLSGSILLLSASTSLICLATQSVSVPTTQAARTATRPAQTRPTSSRPASTRPVQTRLAPQSRPSQAASIQPATRIPKPDLVRFPTEDNLLITGAYTPPPATNERAPMVILLHMYRSDHTAFDPLVPRLHSTGFAVLAIDLRGHGNSVGPAEMGLVERVARRDKKLFQAMDHDVEGAYRWLAQRPEVDPARFILVGASVGCSVALKYASGDRSVDGIVCLTPGTGYLGIDSLSDARKYGRRPLLLLACEDERAACDELARVVPEATVHIVPSVNSQEEMPLHGTRMFGQIHDIEQTITSFLLKAAGPPSKNPVAASVQGEVYRASAFEGARQISQDNVRWYSSPEEAESRGLRPQKARNTRGRNHGQTNGGEPFPGSDNP